MAAKKVGRTDDDLRNAAIDVTFEFKMLQQGWNRLDVSSPSLGQNNSAGNIALSVPYNPSANSTPQTSPAGDMTDFQNIEGILIHFRNLIRFFFTQGSAKEVSARHFTGKTLQLMPVWAQEYKQRCDELLAHLTYRRSSHYRPNNLHHWPDIGEKCRLMNETINEFLNSLPPERKVWFR